MQESRSSDEVQKRTRAHTLLSQARFSSFHRTASELSGGWKKRLDILRSLMNEPDVVLLDEPTNHLDIEGILWLERLLKQEKRSYIITSHDRTFLENVTNKTMELNRRYPKGLFIGEGPLSSFLELKEEFLQSLLQKEGHLTAKLRSEIEWVKRSPKARTTKSRSRVQRVEDMQEELSSLKGRNKEQKIVLSFSESERETKKLLVTKNLTKAFENKPLFQGLDLTLSPGTRLGIVGKNGTGKTTLMKILAGKLAQDMGTRKCADNLQIVYFDQHREQIPSHITLKEALCPHGDFVEYRGQPMHVNGWARKFLFPSERLALPVGYLSGGERARIHIAKLMLEKADILFLDEPTNDLDIDTLEVIEEELLAFQGAVVLITHDRRLMDTLCTSIVGLGGQGADYLFSDYSQWEQAEMKHGKKTVPTAKTNTSLPDKIPTVKKLSYQETKELEKMETTIQAQEKRLEEIEKKISSLVDATIPLSYYTELASEQHKLEALYTRWQELSER
jgi:ATP-binding cassette subfamily F protein uup